jgi:hypothetical protein
MRKGEPAVAHRPNNQSEALLAADLDIAPATAYPTCITASISAVSGRNPPGVLVLGETDPELVHGATPWQRKEIASLRRR